MGGRVERTAPEVEAKILAMYAAGEPVLSIKKATGVSAIYAVLRRAGLEPSRGPYRGGRPELRDRARDDAIAAIATVCTQLEMSQITRSVYDQWRTTQSEPLPPSAETIRVRCGSWRAACLSAGYLPGSRAVTPRHDFDDAVAWVQAAAGVVSGPLTQRRYDQWRLQQHPRPWTSKTIVARFGWSATLKAAGVPLAPLGRQPAKPKRTNQSSQEPDS